MRLFLWLSIILFIALTHVEAGKKKNKKSREETVEHSSEENSSEENEIGNLNRTVTSTVSSVPARVRHPSFRRTTRLVKSTRPSPNSQSTTRSLASTFEQVANSTAFETPSLEGATLSPNSEQYAPAETSTRSQIADITNEAISELSQTTDSRATASETTVIAFNSEQNSPGETSTGSPIMEITVEAIAKGFSTKSTDSKASDWSTTVTSSNSEQNGPAETSMESPIVDFTIEAIIKEVSTKSTPATPPLSSESHSEWKVVPTTEPAQVIASTANSLRTTLSFGENSTEEAILNNYSSMFTTEADTTETPLNETMNRETIQDLLEGFNSTVTEIENEGFIRNTSNISYVASDSDREVTEIFDNSTLSGDHEAGNFTSTSKSETVQEGSNGGANETVTVDESTAIPDFTDEEKATLVNSTTETYKVSNVSTTTSTAAPPTSNHSISETQRSIGTTSTTGSPAQKKVVQQRKKSGFFMFLPF